MKAAEIEKACWEAAEHVQAARKDGDALDAIVVIGLGIMEANYEMAAQVAVLNRHITQLLKRLKQ